MIKKILISVIVIAILAIIGYFLYKYFTKENYKLKTGQNNKLIKKDIGIKRIDNMAFAESQYYLQTRALTSRNSLNPYCMSMSNIIKTTFKFLAMPVTSDSIGGQIQNKGTSILLPIAIGLLASLYIPIVNFSLVHSSGPQLTALTSSNLISTITESYKKQEGLGCSADSNAINGFISNSEMFKVVYGETSTSAMLTDYTELKKCFNTSSPYQTLLNNIEDYKTKSDLQFASYTKILTTSKNICEICEQCETGITPPVGTPPGSCTTENCDCKNIACIVDNSYDPNITGNIAGDSSKKLRVFYSNYLSGDQSTSSYPNYNGINNYLTYKSPNNDYVFVDSFFSECFPCTKISTSPPNQLEIHVLGFPIISHYYYTRIVKNQELALKSPNNINPYLSPYTYNNSTNIDSSLKAFKDSAYLYLYFINFAILRYLRNLKFLITNISSDNTVEYYPESIDGSNFTFLPNTQRYYKVGTSPIIKCYIERNTSIKLINDTTQTFPTLESPISYTCQYIPVNSLDPRTTDEINGKILCMIVDQVNKYLQYIADPATIYNAYKVMAGYTCLENDQILYKQYNASCVSPQKYSQTYYTTCTVPGYVLKAYNPDHDLVQNESNREIENVIELGRPFGMDRMSLKKATDVLSDHSESKIDDLTLNAFDAGLYKTPLILTGNTVDMRYSNPNFTSDNTNIVDASMFNLYRDINGATGANVADRNYSSYMTCQGIGFTTGRDGNAADSMQSAIIMKTASSSNQSIPATGARIAYCLDSVNKQVYKLVDISETQQIEEGFKIKKRKLENNQTDDSRAVGYDITSMVNDFLFLQSVKSAFGQTFVTGELYYPDDTTGMSNGTCKLLLPQFHNMPSPLSRIDSFTGASDQFFYIYPYYDLGKDYYVDIVYDQTYYKYNADSPDIIFNSEFNLCKTADDTIVNHIILNGKIYPNNMELVYSWKGSNNETSVPFVCQRIPYDNFQMPHYLDLINNFSNIDIPIPYKDYYYTVICFNLILPTNNNNNRKRMLSCRSYNGELVQFLSFDNNFIYIDLQTADTHSYSYSIDKERVFNISFIYFAGYTFQHLCINNQYFESYLISSHVTNNIVFEQEDTDQTYYIFNFKMQITDERQDINNCPYNFPDIANPHTYISIPMVYDHSNPSNLIMFGNKNNLKQIENKKALFTFDTVKIPNEYFTPPIYNTPSIFKNLVYFRTVDEDYGLYIEYPRELNLLDNNNGSFTFECWYFNRIYSQAEHDTLFSNGQFTININNDNTSQSFIYFNGVRSNPIPPTFNKWTHIAVVFINNVYRPTVKFYVNGMLNKVTTTEPVILNGRFDIGRGLNPNTGNIAFLDQAYLYDVRLWNVERTSDQINNYKNSYIFDNTNYLIFVYLMILSPPYTSFCLASYGLDGIFKGDRTQNLFQIPFGYNYDLAPGGCLRTETAGKFFAPFNTLPASLNKVIPSGTCLYLTNYCKATQNIDDPDYYLETEPYWVDKSEIIGNNTISPCPPGWWKSKTKSVCYPLCNKDTQRRGDGGICIDAKANGGCANGFIEHNDQCYVKPSPNCPPGWFKGSASVGLRDDLCYPFCNKDGQRRGDGGICIDAKANGGCTNGFIAMNDQCYVKPKT